MLRYRIVDVFSERPLEGNGLCVVLDRCPEELMQRIAREVNLSETTFPVQTGEYAYEMRIFTPTQGLSFAGHPSVGTAWLLGPGRWTQTTGTVIVEADERGAMMTQPQPEFEQVEAEADEVLSALTLVSAEAIYRSSAGGITQILVATSEPIDRLDLDLGRVAAVSRACRGLTLVPFRKVDGTTLQARAFAPAAGVPEDWLGRWADRAASPPALGHRDGGHDHDGNRDRTALAHRCPDSGRTPRWRPRSAVRRRPVPGLAARLVRHRGQRPLLYSPVLLAAEGSHQPSARAPA